MKKIIFGFTSALLTTIGISASRTTKISRTTYYWFIIPCGYELGQNIALTNQEVLFLARATTIPIIENPCNEIPISQCLVGFTANQIFTTTGGGKVLKTQGVDPLTSIVTQTSKTAPTSSAYVQACDQ